MNEEKKFDANRKRFEELTWPAFKGIVESVEGFFEMITDDQLLELDSLLDKLNRTHFELNWKGRVLEEKQHRGIGTKESLPGPSSELH